jgi:hypothetical protein
VKVAPQKIQQTVHLTRNLGINTVYSEDRVDPGLANTIAQEIPNSRKIARLLYFGEDKQRNPFDILALLKKRLKNHYFIGYSKRDHSVDITYCIVLIIILKAEVVIYCSDNNLIY